MYLITGGAGFIGSHIAQTLLANGEKVRILDNFSTGHKKNLEHLSDKYKKNLEIITGSICDLELCKKATKGIKYISHHAAIPSVQRSVDNPLETNESNIIGTLNLLESARNLDGLEKLIYAASSSVYGNIEGSEKIETMPPLPLSPYALQKFTGELYTRLYSSLYNLPTLAFRYFNVFGPRQDPNSQYSAVIPRFIKAILANENPIIYGDGKQSRDFTYIDNVVSANILGFQAKTSGEVINIACGASISLNNLIVELELILGKKVKPTYTTARPGDVQHSLASIKKAKSLLAYNPIVTCKEGLKKTLAWMQKN